MIEQSGEHAFDYTLHNGNGSGRVQWHFLDASRLPVAVQTWELPPGASEGMHVHDPREQPLDELYVVLTGSGRMHVDDDTHDITVGDSVLAAAGSRHDLENTGPDPLRLLVIWGKPETHRLVELRNGTGSAAGPSTSSEPVVGGGHDILVVDGGGAENVTTFPFGSNPPSWTERSTCTRCGSGARASQTTPRSRPDRDEHMTAADTGENPTPTSTSTETKGASVIVTVIQVLRCFTADAPLQGVTEIAGKVGLHKSSVSRILATLEKEQIVERDTQSRKYRLGLGLLSVAGPLLADLDVRRAALPVLRDLAVATGETCALVVWSGSQAVTVEQVPSPQQIKHTAPLGTRYQTAESASVQVFLAELPDDEVRARIRAGQPTLDDTSDDALDTFRRRAEAGLLPRLRRQPRPDLS